MRPAIRSAACVLAAATLAIVEPIVAAGLLSDQLITTKVGTKLQFNKQLWRTGIQVETKDGVVTLSGNVASKQHIAEAGRLAASVGGVKSVRNQLRVGPPEFPVGNAPPP
jgi:osmotically-inducible protein OsmY